MIFGLLSVIVSIFSVITAYLLYIATDPTFTFFTNWISDLGIGPNGANIIFNLGLVVSGVLNIGFQLYVVRNLRKKGGPIKEIQVLQIIGIIATIGLIFVGLFPYNISLLAHGLSANIYFIGAFSYFILYGYISFKTPKVSNMQGIFSVFTALFFGVHVVLLFQIPILPSIFAPIIKVSEWLTLIALDSWLFQTVIISSKIYKHLRKILLKLP